MTEWKNGIAQITLPTPFPVGDVHCYVIKGDALTLVDAGPKTDEALDLFKQQLKDLHLTPSDIDQVIYTHHHPDHVGLTDYLEHVEQIIGHEYGQRWLIRDEAFTEYHRTFYQNMFHQLGVDPTYFFHIKGMEGTLKYSSNRPLTMTVAEGDYIPGLNEWLVIETPGHAQSHLSFYHKKSQTLIGGDHVLATLSSNPLLEPPQEKGEERPKPQLQYNESLRKLKNYEIGTVLPGHGPNVAHVHALVDRRITRQHERAMKVKNMITEKPGLTAFEICKQLFPQAYERELSLTLSETVAQLDYLQSIGEVTVMAREDSVLTYMSGN